MTSLECVINISEGTDQIVLRKLVSVCETSLIDLHVDAHHNRSVFTLAGRSIQEIVSAALSLASRGVELLDIRTHKGIHPRLGVVDVVPFVPLNDTPMTEAVRARNTFAQEFSRRFDVPCFVYGQERSLPEIRREAFANVSPQYGPAQLHDRAGACTVGARPILIAYNVWLDTTRIAIVKDFARQIRIPNVVRSLGLQTGDHSQVSCNVVDYEKMPIDQLYSRICELARDAGIDVLRAELVGLIPESALPTARELWSELDLSVDKTIEARINTSLDWGKQLQSVFQNKSANT